jgi:hypothetical protein
MPIKQEEGETKYCLSGRDGEQKILVTSAANQTSMFRSCNPQHGYSTNCVLLRVLQTTFCISSRDFKHFLGLILETLP